MIKGLGYLKYLKLCLIGFGISCFMGLGVNSVSAEDKTQLVGLDQLPSVVNSNFNIGFLKGGGLISSSLGTSKRVLAFDSNALFWWASNGLPYVYSPNFQGFFGYYYVCPELTGADSKPSNCSAIPIDSESYVIFQGFFQKVKAGDYAYYSYFTQRLSSANGYSNVDDVSVCWSSSEVHQTLCFSYYYCRKSNLSCPTAGIGSLTDSQQLSNLTFANVPQSYLSYAPGQNGYMGGGNIDGGSQDVGQSGLTGDVMNGECTKQKALTWYRANGYKTRMCYSSYGNVDDLYSGPGDATYYALTGVDILDVWFDGGASYYRYGVTGTAMGYEQRFNYWRKTYEAYKRNPEHTNPFVGVPVAIFTLMGNIDAYGLPYSNASIIEFCDLSLYTANYNATYTGVAQSAVCSMTQTQYLDAVVQNQLNPDDGLPGDGTTQGTVTTVGSSWVGITNRPGYQEKPGGGSSSASGMAQSGLNTYEDGVSFQNGYFNELKGVFRFPDSTGGGVLPSYIILALCALLFFRFISH